MADLIAEAEAELLTWRASKKPAPIASPPRLRPATRLNLGGASSIAAWRIERASHRGQMSSRSESFRQQMHQLADDRARRVEQYNHEVQMSHRVEVQSRQSSASPPRASRRTTLEVRSWPLSPPKPPPAQEQIVEEDLATGSSAPAAQTVPGKEEEDEAADRVLLSLADRALIEQRATLLAELESECAVVERAMESLKESDERDEYDMLLKQFNALKERISRVKEKAIEGERASRDAAAAEIQGFARSFLQDVKKAAGEEEEEDTKVKIDAVLECGMYEARIKIMPPSSPKGGGGDGERSKDEAAAEIQSFARSYSSKKIAKEERVKDAAAAEIQGFARSYSSKRVKERAAAFENAAAAEIQSFAKSYTIKKKVDDKKKDDAATKVQALHRGRSARLNPIYPHLTPGSALKSFTSPHMRTRGVPSKVAHSSPKKESSRR